MRKIGNIWAYLTILVVIGVFLLTFFVKAIAFQSEINTSQEVIRKPTKPANQISLIFGGDVMLARTVEQKILKTDDWSLPFRKVYKEFKKADLAFANLESPFYDKGEATPNGSTVFRALPKTIEGLKLAGIDIVSLANNHFGDQGVAGDKYTFEHLTDNKIKYCGAGNNSDEAHSSVIFEVKKIKIAYLCYSYPETMYVAKADSPGIANMDTEQMKKDVENLTIDADFIIVSMHAGSEYIHKPGNSQINFARSAIDSGADLVVGHHPHVVQSTEKYQDGYIIYSLGNLVFDQMWSEETQQGMVAKVNLVGDKLEKIEFKPIHIYDYNQPDWADESEATAILEDMGLESLVVTLSEAKSLNDN
jgi:poly-gamma-glutamate synthesis protein (capsule biosynthesis protein)